MAPNTFCSLLLTLCCTQARHADAFFLAQSTRRSSHLATARNSHPFVDSGSTTAELQTIFTQATPLLDVRSESEFSKGSFPNTVSNVPLLNDEQRRLVGICYKEKGQEAAIALGHALITPELKEQRIMAWKNHVLANPDGCLYCFRGGLRSKIAQQWIQEAGLGHYPRIVGGYKAMRAFLMEDLERSIQSLPLVMIGGRTATGKTHFLRRLARHVDLEALANHRGSSFGALLDAQPTQIDFENCLSVEFLQLRQAGRRLPVFIEEEGRRIGQRILPLSMHVQMLEHYPVVVLEASMEQRVKTCVQDYITDAFPAFKSRYGQQAHERFSRHFLDGLFRIRKRLGGDRYRETYGQLDNALDLFERCNDESGFYKPFETLLRDYYDPMYDYQSTKRRGEVLFQGNQEEVLEWIESYVVC